MSIDADNDKEMEFARTEHARIVAEILHDLAICKWMAALIIVGIVMLLIKSFSC